MPRSRQRPGSVLVDLVEQLLEDRHVLFIDGANLLEHPDDELEARKRTRAVGVLRANAGERATAGWSSVAGVHVSEQTHTRFGQANERGRNDAWRSPVAT